MDLYKLKSFYTVAKLGSFSRAAEILFLTQPAVSAQVKELEYEYKTKLFDRVGRKTKLTQSGEVLLTFAKNILDTYDESHFAVDMLKDAKDGIVKIGVSGLSGSRVLPSYVSKFKTEFPEVSFSMQVLKSAEIIDSIKQNKFDLGIVVNSDSKINKPELIEHILYKDKIVIGVSKNHPLAKKKSISVSELSNLPLIVSLKNTVSRQGLDKLFRKFSIPFNIEYEIDSTIMTKSMVERNLGVAFFSTLDVQREVNSNWIHSLEIEDVPFHRYIIVIHHKNRDLSPTVKAFHNFIFNPEKQEEFIRENGPDCI
ncbi:MAG: LysR family transcriptional regulator [Spirochaetales bacterium]|nr:LysR family transcriptional regulator [Spirochaetales bacterium]